MPMADALPLLPQPLYVHQTVATMLLHMEMLVQVAVIKQPVELRTGLIPEPSCGLTNRR